MMKLKKIILNKINSNKKNEDQSWYKNQIKSSSKSQNCKKKRFGTKYIAIKRLIVKFDIINK
jgi:hypothetical protein